MGVKMVSRAKLTLLVLVGLLTFGAVAAAVAYAEEKVEAPYWKVGGKRLGTGQSQEVKIKNKSGTKAVLHGKISGVSFEGRCTTLASSGASVIGSPTEHDGKVEGGLSTEGCALFVGGKEQKECKYENLKWGVKGKLWYEGSKSVGGKKIAVLLEPKSGSAFGTQTLEGPGCGVLEGTYKLEGSIAASVAPQDTELTVGELSFPKLGITQLWQNQDGETERHPQLVEGGGEATFEGEDAAELVSESKFGAFNK
jgi:hypothetical protein